MRRTASRGTACEREASALDAAEKEGREVIEPYRETLGERDVEVAPVWRPTLADQVGGDAPLTEQRIEPSS